MATLPSHPRTATEVLDTYFLETRAKLIEIAANLDRAERAPGAGAIRADPRLAFVAEALKVLQGPGPNRAEQIQRLYSKS
jgi:hypothetical protein